MGFSMRMSKGVRVRASSRGLRVSVGPRAARVHFGTGRAGISTGAGPLTVYAPLGGGGRGTSTSSASRQLRGATNGLQGSSKAEQIRALPEAIQKILSLHREDFTVATHPQIPRPAVPSADTLAQKYETQVVSQFNILQRRQRREARAQIPQLVETERQQLIAQAEADRQELQQAWDSFWTGLVANDPATVMAALGAAFEDNEAAAAAVGVHGDELSLTVEVPGIDVVPTRMPGTTAAGNPSLKKATKTELNDLYLLMVSGYVLVTVKEALATAPAIGSVHIVAFRQTRPDAYGHVSAEAVLAASFTRGSLTGIQWQTANAIQILNDASTELVCIQQGAARELKPIDPGANPEIAELLAAVDVETNS
ncbi:DUF4236 domain-containing protein [Propionibacterium freudenreichii]|uniref:DUF4236 domain-containing protein n=1 Tax=Propionibacterium freudenreichii TaxID=1744 RepID=UPI002551686B|nr:DUF4236 domain-containing protein [Propionibacterium freudenreichii]MDK9662690.1 DUF4236 domain-containing protein [Propionibacterium freudenreichii]